MDLQNFLLARHLKDDALEDDNDVLWYLLLKAQSNHNRFEKNFCIDEISETEAWERLRFQKLHIDRLRLGLLIPDNVITSNRLNVSGTEAVCILLRRLSDQNTLANIGREFRRNPVDISVIFNHVIDHIYQHFYKKVKTLKHNWLLKRKFSDAVAAKGAPLKNCIGFIDGSIRPLGRPSEHQQSSSSYTGQKRSQNVKFQSVMLPNGIIGHMHGPMDGKRHDTTLLSASGLLDELDTIGDYCIYGDQAYPQRRYLISPHRGADLTPEKQDFNTAMDKVRVCVEWGFDDLIKNFAFLDLEKSPRLMIQPVAKYYAVATILANCRTCLYGNLTSTFFNVSPPTLEDYLL